MRVLLGSGGFRTDDRVRTLRESMRSFFGGISRLLFIPYALQDHDAYVRMIQDRGLHADYPIDGIHRHAEARQAVESADAIFVGGGNTFRLLHSLYKHDIVGAIGDRVRAGIPYLGISAGSNVACPTIQTTNDMPIVQPPSFQAIGLVPFQINPHYFAGRFHVLADGAMQEHFGETRDERIKEFHEMNETPVVGLWEGGLLRLEDERIHVLGAPARVFRRGLAPEDRMPGSLLDELVGGPLLA